MGKKQKISIFLLLLLVASLTFASSCEKDDDNATSDNPTNGKTTAVFNPAVNYGTMTDKDGNVYKTVTIGMQTWMAENLRTTKYNDGTAIPNITAGNIWDNLTTGAYCNYNNTSNNDTIATYGRLYNWYAVNTGKLAPTGWHVPSDDEWATLTTFLGGVNIAGVKLKESGTSHWLNPNTGATNETGFTALPGGHRFSNGPFYGVVSQAFWWSDTEFNATTAWYRFLYYNESNVTSYYSDKDVGFSVRCIRD